MRNRRAQRNLTLALALIAVAPWVVIVFKIQTARPVASPEQPTAIVWADRVFGSEHALAVWLQSRGASYSDWATAHPVMARILAHGGPLLPPQVPAARHVAAPKHRSHPAAPKHVAPAHTAPKPAPTVTAPAPTVTTPAPAVVAAHGGTDLGGLARRIGLLAAKIATLLFVLALLAFSLGPDRFIVRIRPGVAEAAAITELRLAAFAAAVSLGVGVTAAHLLG